MTRAAYFQCIGGVSGDMILGALADAGLSARTLSNEIAKLGLAGYRIESGRDARGGLNGTKVNVVVDESMPVEHRSLSDIISIICASDLDLRVKERSGAVFLRLAEAEAKVHRTTVEEVKFHEVGAVDSIVDVVGGCVGLELLQIDRVFCSPIPSGGGTVSSRHGRIPAPGPAVLELMSMANAPIRPTSQPDTELSTPTGVAFMTTLASFDAPDLTVEQVGYGLGSKKLGDYPNALSLWLGEIAGSLGSSTLSVLETNIDDMNPEMYGYVMEKLFEAKARDVWFTPIQMKKGRPATMLSVLALPEDEGRLVQMLLRETSSLGLRVRSVRRVEAEREVREFDSSLGRVAVKVKLLHGKPVGVSPEYEACRHIAKSTQVPLQEVYRVVSAEAGERFLNKVLNDPSDHPPSPLPGQEGGRN